MSQSLTRRYQTDAVLSMTPEQLLLKLYEHAVRKLAEARQRMIARDPAGAGAALSRVIAIVGALRAALDLDVEAQAVPLLDRLYATVNDWLIEANLRQEPEPIEASQRILSTLKEGWDGAVRTASR